MIMNLHCLGCGELLVPNYKGGMLAISCSCGAESPILVDENGKFQSCSLSLARALTEGSSIAHYEIYLGYRFTHTDIEKSQWTLRLRDLGMTSQQDCDEEQCLREYERKVTHAVYNN